MEHELKTWPSFFRSTVAGLKMFELRKNDRNFQVGDTLVLQEWAPLTLYSGQQWRVRVRYILSEMDGIEEGYVVLGTGEE